MLDKKDLLNVNNLFFPLISPTILFIFKLTWLSEFSFLIMLTETNKSTNFTMFSVFCINIRENIIFDEKLKNLKQIFQSKLCFNSVHLIVKKHI